MSFPIRMAAQLEHDTAEGPLIQTSVSGTLVALSPRSTRSAFFGMPMMTLMVIARIHWQAVRLWFKRVPFFRKPAPPTAFLTR